ncbi:dephospho-CoA kinase [Maridesulfovibrio hydrothermalis]|uniref:Dephospho-CoA kinase n=1 Tax=Maridesulfovibrio hydrothermalis AM13 = DSM 14728 TaxID=1121451 RepID=L0RBQ1_9BACT|nr:dephospho-CoA kinase [Maridesulfovibrio hydrothermalis]CCO24189.1 Pseudouridine synthase, RluA family [Maridesulfovibrio hydrothermalis AM13 = DSM 14728]
MSNNEDLLKNEAELSWNINAKTADFNVRLDKFWGTALEAEGISRGKVKDWIKAGLAEINGKVCKKPNQKLMGTEELSLKGESEITFLTPEDKPLDIIFNDGRIAIINKPAGLTTHPAPSCPDDTLVHRLIHHFPEIREMDQWRPGIVHRLDKFTSGLIAIAQNDHDRLALSAAFSERDVSKTYLAIVHGVPHRDFDEIDQPMGRHPIHKTKMAIVQKGGRDARSSYEVLWCDPAKRASLVKVKIFTGRTHQIRVHMAHIGHPLVGDQTYGAQQHHIWQKQGKPLADLAQRQMLHAYSLSFNHPGSGEKLSFTLEPPRDFVNLLEELNRSVQRVGLIGMPCSGKSAVLDILTRQGIPVFSADESVANSYLKDGSGWEMIRQRFGNRFIDSETGDIDKKALFATMRDDESLRREIMNIVHPIVRHEAEEFFKANATAPLAVAEVPLLLEAGWHCEKAVDAVIGVRCPTDKRTGELRDKRNLSPEILAVFDSWQWDEKAKMDCCTTVIENDADMDKLENETSKALDKLATLRKNKEIRFKKFLRELFKTEKI